MNRKLCARGGNTCITLQKIEAKELKAYMQKDVLWFLKEGIKNNAIFLGSFKVQKQEYIDQITIPTIWTNNNYLIAGDVIEVTQLANTIKCEVIK